MPSTIEQLHRELSPRGLAIVGVNIEESQQTVAAWIRARGITLPVALDLDGQVTRRYGVVATPTQVLIDRQGRAVGRVVGPRDWATPQARALISSLLEAMPSR